MKSQFIWVACQNGIEHVLKSEVAQKYPDYKFAFSRPGFLTFKLPTEASTPPNINLIFGRIYGLGFGKHKLDALTDDLKNILDPLLEGSKINCIHLFERERFFIDERPKNFTALQGISQLGTKVFKLYPNLKPDPDKAPTSVLDLIFVEHDEIWLGVHRHSPLPYTVFGNHPGGESNLVLPQNAPSRAWLKIEEMLLWSKLIPKNSETAIEVGCAPGGALFSLLEHGLKIYGIDSGELAEQVAFHDNLKHIKESIFKTNANDLPKKADWILVDMNTEPSKSLSALSRIMDTTGLPKRAAILTFKMSKKNSYDELPRIIEHLKRDGFKNARAKQLPSHKREVGVIATP